MNLPKLNALQNFHGRKGPLLLVIMDGIGIGPSNDTNAVFLANTPNLDSLIASPLYTTLKAHGKGFLPSELPHLVDYCIFVFLRGKGFVWSGRESRQV